MPDPVQLLTMPVHDVGLDPLPEYARRRDSSEFMVETTRLLEQGFAVVGGRAELKVGPEAVEVDWTAPPTGDAHTVTSPLPARRCASRKSWRARRLLLLVDDEPELRSMFRKVLEAEPGTRVVEAGTSEEALQLVWWRKFDLVISDINHPHMNGLELLKVLKQEQPDLPVMIVSGALDGTRWQQAQRLGACCGLTKPFCGSTLLGVVAVALRG